MLERGWRGAGERLERGWRRLEKGWRGAGEGLERGWRRAGERLERGWKEAGEGPGTRINRGRRGTAISGIWPSRSRYRENDRDNRDKWNPKKTSLKIVFCHF